MHQRLAGHQLIAAVVRFGADYGQERRTDRNIAVTRGDTPTEIKSAHDEGCGGRHQVAHSHGVTRYAVAAGTSIGVDPRRKFASHARAMPALGGAQKLDRSGSGNSPRMPRLMMMDKYGLLSVRRSAI